jgi:hypothetical protein
VSWPTGIRVTHPNDDGQRSIYRYAPGGRTLIGFIWRDDDAAPRSRWRTQARNTGTMHGFPTLYAATAWLEYVDNNTERSEA